MQNNSENAVNCPEAAGLRDRLTGALVGIARASFGNEHMMTDDIRTLVLECLMAGDVKMNLNADGLQLLIRRAEDGKRALVPDCFTCVSPCGRTKDYDMANMQDDEEDVRALKLQLLDSIREIAAGLFQPASQGVHVAEVETFLYTALFFIGENAETEDLEPLLQQANAILAEIR